MSSKSVYFFVCYIILHCFLFWLGRIFWKVGERSEDIYLGPDDFFQEKS